MAPSGVGEWCKLPISLTELCINTTLRCGQSFRWRKSSANEWTCTLHGRILTLRQDAAHLHYRAIFPSSTSLLSPAKKRIIHDLPTPSSSPACSTTSTEEGEDDTLKLLTHYLNLAPDLSSLYAQWSATDPNFRKKVLGDMDNLQGIRILRQDPWEALCGFICSSNNNIKRISMMMNKLCSHYGTFIAEVEEDVDASEDGELNESLLPVTPPSESKVDVKLEFPAPLQDVTVDVKLGLRASKKSKTVLIKRELSTPQKESRISLKRKSQTVKVAYHDFPPPEALTGNDVEATLRQLGFGYRAKYIAQTARVLVNEKGGLPWLHGLTNPEPFQSVTDVLPPGGREGYRAAHDALLELTGVGPKVADCVCLMGLGWGESVPVDTHVWQIAVRDYKFKGGKGGMTKALYAAVGDRLRELWGVEAGWAHSVLFTADLGDFKKRS